MHKIFLLIFSLSALYSRSQPIQIDTLRWMAGWPEDHSEKNTLKFPLLRTGDKAVDLKINTDIKNRLTCPEFKTFDIDSALKLWSQETISHMSFEVTYLKNKMISLNISLEGCGAYCSNWTEYFNYSTSDGRFLSIGDIVDTTGYFRTRVIADKNKQYEEQKKKLKELFLDKNSGLDEDSYHYALEDYNRCGDSNDITIFSLQPNYLEIINTCSLPNAIKNLNPVIELKYKYADIKNYLKIRN